MASDTQKCSPEPIFKGLTNLVLRTFGTNQLPTGYVKRDGYGPKTRNEEFAELFTIFYILIVLAVLCVLAFLLMIILLLWYYSRHKYKPEPCKNPKLCTTLLTVLLLLSLILLAVFLFATFKNLLQLKKVYNNNESSTEKGSMMESVDEILNKDFKLLRIAALLDCRRSNYLTDVYPETTGARKFSIANSKIFENFIETSIDPAFDNILLYEDMFRMFSRNFSAFIGSSKLGNKYVPAIKSALYNDAIFSLEEWGTLYQSSMAIKELMNLYKESPRSDERNLRVCNEIKQYFTELASHAKAQRTYLASSLRSYTQSKDPAVAPPYKFGHIVCIMAIVVLVLFFLFLMCALCMKGKIMIKALLFIFIILTLLLILMAFVTIYHFFYGVIEYNGLCQIKALSARRENFNNIILTECTNDQNLYTLLSEHNVILPISQWADLDAKKILNVCKNTCRPFNMSALEDLRSKVVKFPKKNQFCKFKSVTSTWLINIRLVHMAYDSVFSKSWMVDLSPHISYYYKRVKSSHCLLDLAIKASKFRPKFNRAKYLKCRAGYNIGREFVMSIPYTDNEVKTMCEIANRRCTDFANQEIPSIIANVNKYKNNAERRIKNVLGSCANIIPMVRRKQNKSCNCETYILNGVWVGGLLFVLSLFLALPLLACLICKLERCRKRDESDAEPILLPAITLPRRVIDTLEHDESPRVTYQVKKLN